MDTSVSNGVTISMTTPDFRIEQATIEDVPLILSFIKDLAEYEKLLHEIVVTEDILRKNLFGENPVARALLAYYRGARLDSLSIFIIFPLSWAAPAFIW